MDLVGSGFLIMKISDVWRKNNRSLDRGDDSSAHASRRSDWWVWLTVGLTLLGLLGLSIRVLANHQWNPRAFILETPEGVPEDQGWGVGYDGRFVYQMAVNPWGSTEGLDAPNYRYQRIMYPLFVKILSLGQTEAVPWAMLLINLAAAGFAVFFLATLLNWRGALPLWSLIVPFSLGYLITIRMNLLEPLALAFAFGGWVAYERDHKGWAILFFALGGLTKELALTFPAAIVAWEILRKEWRTAAYVLVGSTLPYLIFYLLLLGVFGSSQEALAKSSLYLIPFGGLRFLTDPPSRVIVMLWVVIPALAGALWALIRVWKNPIAISSRDALLVLMNVALLSVLPQLTWEDPLAILRFGLGTMSALIIMVGNIKPRLLPYLAVLWLPSGILLFLAPGLL